MLYENKEAWKAEGERRFGPNVADWKFRCPKCGHIAAVRDFVEAGVKIPGAAHLECIGRHKGKGVPQPGDDSGCDFCAYDGIPADLDHDTIVEYLVGMVDIFPFAEAEGSA